MTAGTRGWLALSAYVLTLPAASAQDLTPPSAPPPLTPPPVGTPGPLPPTAPVLGPPQPTLPPPPAPAPLPPPPPAPPPLFAAPDPGPAGWGPFGPASAAPAFFFNWEIAVVKPTIQGQLAGTMPFNGDTLVFATPKASLDWTVMPKFEIGYRLPDSAGDFSLAYKFLATEGTGTFADPLGPLALKSRLDMQVFDFDYTSARYAFAPRYELRWRVGARLTSVFFDNVASDPTFSERGSNYFIGGGPHAGFDIERQFTLVPSLALFGRLDGGVSIGQVTQKFRADFADLDGAPASLGFERRATQSVPSLTLQAGLSYTPPSFECLRIVTGYQFERYWGVGKLDEARGDVMTNGVFLRGEISY